MSMFMGNGKCSCRSSAPIPLPWELPQSSPAESKHLIFWPFFPVSFLGGLESHLGALVFIKPGIF